MSTDLGYIAACKCCLPSAPEFEEVVTRCRKFQARLVVDSHKDKLFDELRTGCIDVESYNVIYDALCSINFD